MDKNEFNNVFKEAVGLMSAEELQKAMEALENCKTQIDNRENNNKAELSEKIQNFNVKEATLKVKIHNKTWADLKFYGAGVLSRRDYWNNRSIIPKITSEWWLDDRSYIQNNQICFGQAQNDKIASIRPVLFSKDYECNDLKEGDSFSVNGARFVVISHVMAIKATCLQGACTFENDKYGESVLRYCVDGWYEQLIISN